MDNGIHTSHWEARRSPTLRRRDFLVPPQLDARTASPNASWIFSVHEKRVFNRIGQQPPLNGRFLPVCENNHSRDGTMNNRRRLVIALGACTVAPMAAFAQKKM